MATTYNALDSDRGEARFFLILACAMAAVIFAGFSVNLALGRSSFAVPALFHVHAAFFFGWTVLYVVQNGLIARDAVAVHRKLGWLGIFMVPVMLVLGVRIMVHSLQAHGGPPFFHQAEFLLGNTLQLVTFAGLVAAAVTTRRNTGWHRRYMLTAMALLTGPGFGRLLPMPLFIPLAWWIGVAVSMIFPVIGMIADRRRYGRVHPAWFWAVGAVAAVHVISMLAAHSAWGIDLTRQLVQGTPGAARPMDGFMP